MRYNIYVHFLPGSDFKTADMVNNRTALTFVKKGSTTDCKDTLPDEIEV